MTVFLLFKQKPYHTWSQPFSEDLEDHWRMHHGPPDTECRVFRRKSRFFSFLSSLSHSSALSPLRFSSCCIYMSDQKNPIHRKCLWLWVPLRKCGEVYLFQQTFLICTVLTLHRRECVSAIGLYLDTAALCLRRCCQQSALISCRCHSLASLAHKSLFRTFSTISHYQIWAQNYFKWKRGGPGPSIMLLQIGFECQRLSASASADVVCSIMNDNKQASSSEGHCRYERLETHKKLMTKSWANSLFVKFNDFSWKLQWMKSFCHSLQMIPCQYHY